MTLKKEIVVLSCGDNATSHKWAEDRAHNCVSALYLSPAYTHTHTQTHKYSTQRTVNVNPH